MQLAFCGDPRINDTLCLEAKMFSLGVIEPH